MSYISPILTIDLVLFSFDDDLDLNVLLIKRKNDPFKGCFSLPGGYVDAGKTTYEALCTKIKNKTNVDVDVLKYLEQLYTFDSVARDPRGHAVSVCWYGLCEKNIFKTLSGEDPQWIKVKNLANLSFDHDEVIGMAINRLKDKIWYSNIIFSLVPNSFPLETIIAMYKSLDDEAKEDEIKEYLMSNNVIKTNQDGSYSIKINQLIYYKK